MTITTEALIAAARAIGIEVTKTPNGQLFINDDSSYDAFWNPEHNKAQLMDLQFKLGLSVISARKGYKGVVFLERGVSDSEYDFDNTFESFATAIILAAAEIGENMQ